MNKRGDLDRRKFAIILIPIVDALINNFCYGKFARELIV